MAVKIRTYPLDDTDYTAEDAQMYNATRTSGVYASDKDFIVTPVLDQPLQITVSPGQAWINYERFKGLVAVNPFEEPFTLETADPLLTRIDRVIIRYDATTFPKGGVVDVKTGTPASSPVAPALQRDAEAWELGIADITVTPDTVTLTEANIKDTRLDEELCGLMADGVTREGLTEIFDAIDVVEATANSAHALATTNADKIAGIGYGTSITAAATTAKIVVSSGFVRNIGSIISIKFTYANTAASPTLNVNDTGAAPIYDHRTSTYPALGAMGAGTHDFVFNGTQWILLNPITTPVSGVYTGDGTAGRTISLGFTPSAVLVGANGWLNIDMASAFIVSPYIASRYGWSSVVSTAWNDNESILGIVTNGFKVNYNATYGIRSNIGGAVYHYVAFR